MHVCICVPGCIVGGYPRWVPGYLISVCADTHPTQGGGYCLGGHPLGPTSLTPPPYAIGKLKVA